MAAATPASSLQQQLAEVEEAARRERCPVLVQAARMGRNDVLALLLHAMNSSSAAPAALPSQRDCWAAFIIAAREGHDQCLRVLLDASPSPSAAAELVRATSVSWTPLMWAVSRGHVACARLIQQHSPGEVTYRGIAGRDALMLACERGCVECVALLLQHSPQLQSLDWALGRAAKEWGVEIEQRRRCAWARGQPPGPYQRCMELLLSKGAMLTAEASDDAFALVRSVIHDLAARALAPGMADAAAVQAMQEVRRRVAASEERLRTHLATAAALAADKQPAVATAGVRPEQGPKRGRASSGSNTGGSRGRRRR